MPPGKTITISLPLKNTCPFCCDAAVAVLANTVLVMVPAIAATKIMAATFVKLLTIVRSMA